MGQSSSQIAEPSQRVEIAQTPTPELSDIDQSSSHDAPAHSVVTVAASSEADADTARKARSRITRKPASHNTQRRFLNPRVPRVVPSFEGSEDQLEVQPLRKGLRPLPQAVEDDSPVLRASRVKAEAFSPLRNAKTPQTGRTSPTLILHSPPQVVIPSSEVVAATRAQALEERVESLQGQLDKNVLAEIQEARDGNDWFSKIDEAVAEVQQAHGEQIERENTDSGNNQRQRAVRKSSGPSEHRMDQPASTIDAHDDNPSGDASMRLSPRLPLDEEEELAAEGDEEMGEDNDKEEHAVGDDGDNTEDWPTPTQYEIQECLEKRKLTAGDLELEERIDHPKNAWAVREDARRQARNVLREHIMQWNLDRKVYKGLAKCVTDDNGETSIVYAAEGEKFPVPKRSKAERHEAHARKDSMKSTKTALHESIVRSELEARMMEMRHALREDVLEAEGENAETASAEAFVAAQSPGSTVGAAEAGVIARDVDEAALTGATDPNDEGEAVNAETDAIDEYEVAPGAENDWNIDSAPATDLANASGGAATGMLNVVASPISKPGPKRKVDKGKKPPRAHQIPTAKENAVHAKPQEPLMGRQKEVPGDSGAASIERAVSMGIIPTPPKSDETGNNPLILASRPVNVHVGDWLASLSEEPPVPPEQFDAPAPTSRRQKRTSSMNEEVDIELAPSEVASEDSHSATRPDRAAAKQAKKTTNSKKRRMEDEEDKKMSTPPKAKKRKCTIGSSQQPAMAQCNVTRSGPFTQEEKELADKIFDNVLQKEGLSEAELVAQMKNWRSCGTLKTNMFAAFPDRKLDAVRKFCQRRWHGQERGPWTQEQDDALRSAHASQPGKWTVISDSVGRTAADCKDRWRDHLESGHKTVGPWTVNEEEQLLAAVEECINTIKTEKKEDGELLRDRERLEALVSWRVVSEKLEGKRTMKQCREKYIKLVTALAKTKNNDLSWNTTQRTLDGDDAGKVATARRALQRFEIGDYYDVFVEIHSAFEDPHQHFRDEKNVVWSIVSGKNKHSRFGLHAYSSALRRAALENALATWPMNNAKIKRKLESVDTIPAKALVLAKWVERTYAGRLEAMARTYRSDLLGKSTQELQEIKQSRREKYGRPSRKNYSRSQDYVDNSDDDEDNSGDAGSHSTAGMSEACIPSEVMKDGHGSPESDEGVQHDLGVAKVDENREVSMSDVEGSRGTPSIAPSDFVNRLKSSGSSNRRKSVGYGKKDRMKAERRRTLAS